MKTIYKFPLAIIIAIVLFVPYSCTDGYDELNTNPKLVTDDIIKPGLLFTKVLKESSFEILDQGRAGEYSGYSSRGDSGQPLSFGVFGPFNYTSHIVNLAAIIRLTDEDPALVNMNAMARIWKVWVFHRMTDAFGDIPYFDSAKSFEEVVTSPAYDTQEAIYKDLLNELKESAAQLSSDAGQTGFGAADVLYGGDADSWKRFANSLRLRLAIRVRYTDQTLAQTHISDVLSAPLITSNGQNATVTSEGEGAASLVNTNPLYQNFINGNAGASNATVVGITLTENLLSTADPRMPVYLNPNIDDEYIGRAINMDPDEKENYAPSTAKLDDAFIQAEYDFNAMLAAEISFLRAEAALAGLSSENANNLFREGIQLSMEQYGIDAGDISTFLASAAGTLTGTTEEQLEQIIVQKYLALFGDSYEAWTEHRRTGYPRQWIGSLSALDTDFAMPRRSAYPLSEYNLNGVNVKAAAARLVGGDLLTSRIWWDTKPGVPFDHPKQGVFPPYD
ncbi:SusD/RagB family nutrient-binding outer membrane lipoprotein [Reichenbachiella sp. MALMAid0571]|uniref:SusD/RagB family nutrient-binding outer membrane lipoprotein n=1 Tax=Reichenbachiella sp. MALMAid0571 TaxID=3143939 RepID=UPI0032DF7BB0